MNSFMSWVGGKKALRDAILARMPLFYERYIEVFGGAGWVLFHKPPGVDFEVYNDFNSNLVNLYRCVREKPYKLKNKLKYVLNSREDFDIVASLHKSGKVREESKETYSYASDYQIIARLKAFAGTYGICLMLVHHTRKQQADDKFDMI